MKITRSLLSGVAIAAILIGGVTFGFVSTRMSSSGIHEFKIVFPTADGLVSGSDVLVAGSKVGTISDIEPTQNDQAMVTVGVAGDQWPLHRGLTADIRPKSLLGEKYVDLHDGPLTGPEYDVTATLHAPTNSVPVELDEFVNSLDAKTRTAVRVLLGDLGAGVAGRGHDLNAAIAAGKADLEHLATFGTTLQNRDADLDKILVGLDGILAKLTTNDQLDQMSQLITNGQNTLNDIESVQGAFSRSFTDANVALSELNTALHGAIPSLRSTLDVAPSLLTNLKTETEMLTSLGHYVTTQGNFSPHGECTASTMASQPISEITSGGIGQNIGQPGLAQCSPLWELVYGLLGGPEITGGAVGTQRPTGCQPGHCDGLVGKSFPIFRVCIENIAIPQFGVGACDTQASASRNGAQGLLSSDGQMLMALLES
ncbi:MAG: MCE family protein [Chloroflexi bacterium]|nr:MAG: MCE family protein [Chloroflexota bacterium]